MFDGRRKIGTMKTVIGRPQMPTPMMTGMIRYVVTQPYWNLPEDIVRDSIAREVLRSGIDQLRSRNLEILSDWSDSAAIVDPAAINWQAVARGERTLRVRQRPGPGNMMGQIKFMLPNNLGIYLHDTPARQDFASQRRAQSAGCVRLEDAARLATWVFDGANPIARTGVDRITDLPTPVPVYINYFTVLPTPAGLTHNPDIYRRDRPMVNAARPFASYAGKSS
jgi:murein L,D-transpeptidase YcbB/YkuD